MRFSNVVSNFRVSSVCTVAFLALPSASPPLSVQECDDHDFTTLGARGLSVCHPSAERQQQPAALSTPE
jgi:hypothetical protein